MRNCTQFIFFFLLLVHAACKDKTDSIYANCCGIEPTVDKVLVASPDSMGNPMVESHIFIPNIFVPGPANKTGLNDHFRFFTGEGFYLARSVVYCNDNGDTLYHRENYYPDQDNFSDGWNGQKPDGSIHYGRFLYKIAVEFVDGQTKTYTGEACSFQCGDSGFPKENIPSCFFPSQNNGNGDLDVTLPGGSFCF